MEKAVKGAPRAHAFIALALALAGLWLITPGESRFRTFDAASLGRAEASLWRSYYEHRTGDLALQLVSNESQSFGFSPWDSLWSGASAAQAARAFQTSKSRAEAQAALPALTRHFAIVARATHASFDPAQAAKLELEWWQVRRETDGIEPYVPLVAAASAYLYGIDPHRLQTYARMRSEAMDLRDARGNHIAPEDWGRISALLEQAYGALRTEVAAKPASTA
jgi:hypothetical protein